MPITIPNFRKNKFLSPWIDHLFPKLALLTDSWQMNKKVTVWYFFIELIGHSCCRLVLLSPTRSCLLLFVNVAPSALLTFDTVGCLFLLCCCFSLSTVRCSFLLMFVFVAGYSCCRLLIPVFPVVFCCSHAPTRSCLLPFFCCCFCCRFPAYHRFLLSAVRSFWCLLTVIPGCSLLMLVFSVTFCYHCQPPTRSCLLPFVAACLMFVSVVVWCRRGIRRSRDR